VKSRGIKVIAVVALIAAVVVALSPIIRRDDETQPVAAGQGPLVISLAPPAFAQTAGLKFPMNEAGISAYVNMGTAIDLAKARTLLSVPEDITDTYVIGTVPLTGNTEDMWPHVYIGKDGWLMAYYPASEPMSKLFQWYGYQGGTVNTTTLRDVLISLATNLHLEVSKTETGTSYFHFQYPDATKLIIAVDTAGGVNGNDEFRYTIPSGVALYDATWTHHAEGVTPDSYYNRGGTASTIDGKSLYSGSVGTYTACYSVPEQYRSLNVAHNVAISHSGAGGWMGFAIVFLYR
jgi:hypothetical protein